VSPIISPTLISLGSAIFGALVGSFLNVCIYRLPLGQSVKTPARSFCPHCHKTIPWWENIPVLSWLLLRGRCSSCSNPISSRYLLGEILTATLFWAVATRFATPDPLLLLPYFALLGILIVGTFVDLEHMIIPDEITWGGALAGLLSSTLLPSLHHTQGWLNGLNAPASRLKKSCRGLKSNFLSYENWKEEIARMWRFTRNNGITEGFHRKMKLIQRRAYGFRNFENYRLRVIAACG